MVPQPRPRRIPWVQAILTQHDDREEVRRCQERLKGHGVWVSEPVPVCPYPGTPLQELECAS